MDWNGTVIPASCQGRLSELLATLPRSCWHERDAYDRTLLHMAACGDNASATVALLAHGLDVNARDNLGASPAHNAARFGRARVLEVLCAAGAAVRGLDADGRAPLDRVGNVRTLDAMACVRVLVANGVRLSSAHKHFAIRISPELWAFERGVLRCRAAVVALLRVKQAGQLVRWDKFLLIELAWHVWATRRLREWQAGQAL